MKTVFSLFEIWDHIRQDNPDAADRVEAELLDKCESLDGRFACVFREHPRAHTRLL